MLDRLDILTIRLSGGAMLPIVCFLAGWWGSIPFVPERYVPVGALGGLACGVILAVLLAPKLIRLLSDFCKPLAIVVYLFYSFCVLGFFMGVPVFNLVLGPVAGCYVGRRMKHRGTDAATSVPLVRRAGLFAAGVMVFVCSASAFVALIDPYTAASLQRMLNLPWNMTKPMLMIFIVTGGAVLVMLQYWLTIRTAHAAFRA